MKEKFKELLRKQWFAYIVATCSAVIFYWLLTHLFFIPVIIKYTTPVIWGIFIAYIINPLVNYFNGHLFSRIKRERSRYVISVFVSIVIVIILIVLLFAAFFPPLINSISGIIDNMDVYGDNLSNYINRLIIIAERMNIDASSVAGSAENLVHVFVSSATDNLASIMESFFNVGTGIVNALIGFVLAIYFLFDKKNLIRAIDKIRRLFISEESYVRNNVFWGQCHAILSRFLVFDILEGVVIGLINMVFMLIFKMPYVALISVIVGLTNLIPTIGPIIGALVGALLLVLANPISALLFIIFTIIIQTFDASILKPKMFGNSFGVPPVWILIAIVVGGKLFGMLGVLFAIPVAAIFTYALNEIIIPSLEKRKGTGVNSTDSDSSN